MTTDLNSLFTNAGLDDDAVSAMALTADTFGPAIMAGLGAVGLDDVDASEVLLVTLLIDDSFSIQSADNTAAVRLGHNVVLAALKGSKSSTAILVSCRYLNGDVLYPYVPLDKAVEMDTYNYRPTGGTPLYDMTAVTLAAVAAKTSEFEQGGVAVRSVTYIITDGADLHSRTHRASTIKSIVEAMLRMESHIIGAVGIEDITGWIDFRHVFTEMGIRNEWVLTPKNTESEIRRAFGTVSQSALRASQAAGTFSQTALGGFGN